MNEASVQIVVDHPVLTINVDRVRKLVEFILTKENFSPIYVAVIFTDSGTVHELNREYLQHDYPTDVLSFPFRAEMEIAATREIEGEIYVDLDMASERAPEFKTSFEREAVRYAVHGLLHLCGWEDSDTRLKEEMHAAEDKYLTNY